MSREGLPHFFEHLGGKYISKSLCYKEFVEDNHREHLRKVLTVIILSQAIIKQGVTL